MQATLDAYRNALINGRINPHHQYDGQSSGLIVDCADPDVPLQVISLAIYQLKDGPFAWETGIEEQVLVLQRGHCTVTVNEQTWTLARPHGVFAPAGGPTLSSAVYIPREARCTLAGDGEMLAFHAPASEPRPAACFTAGERAWTSRGSATWRRDVVTLVQAGETSCNLTVGETYNPPGLWSSMPLHRHDRDDLEGGQSDHEEIFYFQFRDTAPPLAAFGVQQLFDSKGLNQSYRVGPRSMMALPGACHPVVAGPGSDLVYVWGLAGVKEMPLRLWDVPDTAFLADVGAVLERIRARSGQPLQPSEVTELAQNAGLDAHARAILEMVLKEQGLYEG